jgi:hypothetical protein
VRYAAALPFFEEMLMNNAPEAKHEGVLPKARQIATAASETLHEVPDKAREQVQKFPLATVGIAFGAGVVLGALGWAMLGPRPATFGDRIGEFADRKRLRKLLARFR